MIDVYHGGELYSLPCKFLRGQHSAPAEELTAAPKWARDAYYWFTCGAHSGISAAIPPL